MSSIVVSPPNASVAAVDLPGDKSISHRAVMCASIARGRSIILDANRGADVRATKDVLRAVGVPIADVDDRTLHIDGVDAFHDPEGALDCGNSGSTMRMLVGLLAGRVRAVLDGDASLRKRPMQRVAEPLAQMGADISTSPSGSPPLTLRRATKPLRGAQIDLRIASAQVKTAILFAGLDAIGETTVLEPMPTRDHTERMLRAMGADVVIDGTCVTIRRSRLRPLASLRVPGDFSAAFFFIAGAAALPGARVVVRRVGVNPTRTAALDVIRRMGADVRLSNEGVESGEPVADVEVRGGAPLRGVDVPLDVVPNLIDEIPALCALAAAADGEFSVRGASELRAKESDRIHTTALLLRSFGVAAEEFDDGLAIRGGRPLSAPERVRTSGDHRIGMSAAVLAVAARTGVQIDDADCIATSFPDFEASWRGVFG
jgi:3-phosphoshikimate 1-carboxyvinyltransferase